MILGLSTLPTTLYVDFLWYLGLCVLLLPPETTLQALTTLNLPISSLYTTPDCLFTCAIHVKSPKKY